MNTSCEIIKDLLPLYHDNICSKQSRQLVQQHLNECLSCTEQLAKMKVEFKTVKDNQDAAKPIKAIGKAWKNDKKKSFLKGVAVAALACVLIVFAAFELTQNKIVPISTEYLKVDTVTQKANGEISFFIESLFYDNGLTCKTTTKEDGTMFITPLKAVVQFSGNENSIHNVIDLSGYNNTHENAPGYGIPVTSIYVGTPEDNILVWKQGMEIFTQE